MNIEDVKLELWEIAMAYPTLRGLLQKEIEVMVKKGDPKPAKPMTVGHHWAMLLKDLDQEIFEDVCHKYATLARPLPEPQDQLVFAIMQEVRHVMSKRESDMEQFLKYHKPCQMPWREQNPTTEWCRIIKWYQMKKQTDEVVELVSQWQYGKIERPDCVPKWI